VGLILPPPNPARPNIEDCRPETALLAEVRRRVVKLETEIADLRRLVNGDTGADWLGVKGA
jgi:hypothetical protein